MGFSKFAVNLFKIAIENSDAKRLKPFVFPDYYEVKKDIPYIDDNNEAHKIDVLYARENRKNICVVDIHGGSYIFGTRKNQYYFAPIFLEAGFDFVAIDYQVNDGNRDFECLLSDCVAAINYVDDHKKELGLKHDRFVLTGDSAGGHLILFLTLLLDSEELQEQYGLYPHIKNRCTLVNCPVYHYEWFADWNILGKSGLVRMFGPKYQADRSYRIKYSPSSIIQYLKTPLFVSTSNYDFLKAHSYELHKDLDLMNYNHYEFVGIQTKNKKAGHVHNVNFLHLPESKEVNAKMIEFINKYC